MIWAMLEVVLPMLLTFLFGLLTGWLWWRRRGVDQGGHNESAGSDVHRLSTSTGTDQSNTIDANAGGGGHSESAVADNQLPHKRSLHEQALAKELTAANASIRALVSELDATRNRLTDCESQLAIDENEIAPAASDIAVHVAGADHTAASELNAIDAGGGSSVNDTAAELTFARSQLKSLQQRYQELETSHSIDRAELAKNQHLEVRLNTMTRELTENKNELAAARKDASRLQTEVNSLKTDFAQQHNVGAIENEYDDSIPVASADGPARLAELEARLAEMAPVAERARVYQSQVAALKANLEQSESRLRQLEESGQHIDQLDSQLQTRLAGELEKSQQRVAELEAKASLTAEKSAELVRSRSRVATLETELGDANSRAEDAGKLQRRVSELEAMLKGSEVKAVNERLVEAEAQLRIATNKVSDQQQQIQRLQKKVSDSPESGAATVPDDNKVEATQSEPVRRQLGAPTADEAATAVVGGDVVKETPTEGGSAGAGAPTPGTRLPEPAGKSANGKSSASTSSASASSVAASSVAANNRDSGATPETPAWQAGVTRFGTPAASHKDDLKVIRGIGPVLERTLNEAEIQTWDQLAALSANEVELIEQSIDFPGRMTREKWVEQASELVGLYPDPHDRPSGRNLLPRKS